MGDDVPDSASSHRACWSVDHCSLSCLLALAAGCPGMRTSQALPPLPTGQVAPVHRRACLQQQIRQKLEDGCAELVKKGPSKHIYLSSAARFFK